MNNQEMPDVVERIRTSVANGDVLDFGQFGLDVGGRNGACIPVIRELGVGSVGLVDPDGEQTTAAIQSGIVDPKLVYPYSLQKYVEAGNQVVDSAFVFNIQPRLASDIGFIMALGSVIRPGGLVVMSAMEAITALQFATSTTRFSTLRRIGSTPPSKSKDKLHAFMHIWRKLEVQV